MHLTLPKTWDNAKLDCYNRGGHLVVLKDTKIAQKISEVLDEYLNEWENYYVGAHAVSDSQWITVRNKIFPFDKFQSLWGPYEPSGDGWCGNMINGEKWNDAWKGKGWRINDVNCFSRQGYICEKKTSISGEDKVFLKQTKGKRTINNDLLFQDLPRVCSNPIQPVLGHTKFRIFLCN